MFNLQKVLISAVSYKEAEFILKSLLDKKLVAGGSIFAGNSFHWWQNEIETGDYCTIVAFTKAIKNKEIIKLVESISADEIPGITFYNIDGGNTNFLNWIKKTI